MMDVKFLVNAECIADNIDVKRSAAEITKMLEEVLENWVGIKAVVEVSGLTYLNETEDER